MKILIAVAYFYPEIGSAAHLYFDLAKAFISQGHEVDVITSYPRDYNLNASDRSRDFPIEEIYNGIYIHRVKHTNIRDNLFIRGMEHFIIPGHYFRRFREIGKKFDVCLIYIPPLPLYYLAKKIKKYDGTPSVLNFQDFHPQELTDVGVLKNPLVIHLLKMIERDSYQKADYITVLSEGGIEYVQNRGARREKVAHIYNSVSVSEIDEFLEKKDFKQKEKIEDKFLISYAGILSPYQSIDNILDAAKELISSKEIIIYIAGDGTNKRHLEMRVADEKISNVKIIPFLPREEYFNLINSSDISLISLDDRMKAPCLPGKTINLMASEKPIIALVPADSETARVVEEAGCGIVIQPGDIQALKKCVKYLMHHGEIMSKMGKSGRNFLIANMNLESSVRKYEEIFSRISHNPGEPKDK